MMQHVLSKPIRFLPAKLRDAIGFSVFLLTEGLAREDTWRGRWKYALRWRRHALQYALAGRTLGQCPLAYEHEWQVHESAPADEIIGWLRRAVNLAPKTEGTGFALCLDLIERNPLRLTPLLYRSFFLRTQDEAEADLRRVLSQTHFSNQTLNLGLFSGAVFAGKPLRPLPD